MECENGGEILYYNPDNLDTLSVGSFSSNNEFSQITGDIAESIGYSENSDKVEIVIEPTRAGENTLMSLSFVPENVENFNVTIFTTTGQIFKSEQVSFAVVYLKTNLK